MFRQRCWGFPLFIDFGKKLHKIFSIDGLRLSLIAISGPYASTVGIAGLAILMGFFYRHGVHSELRTVVPSFIVKQFGFKNGDKIEWTIESFKGNSVIMIKRTK